MKAEKQIETDVLVVGCGGAALRAAIEANDAGAKVILVCKGLLGKSGATAYPVADIAGLAVADGKLDPDDSPEEHLRDISEAGMGMNDPQLSAILTNEARQVVPDLEKWGVNFNKDKEGNYVITKACFSSHPRNYKLFGHGTKIAAALSKQVLARPIIIIEDSMLIDVLTENNHVTGGIILDKTGNLCVVSCNAVILGTGGAGQLFLNNVNPPDVTGDGYAIAFRAGAELMNLEFIQYGMGTLPSKNVFAFWLWAFHPVLRDGDGNEILTKYLPDGVSADECMDIHAGHFPFTNRLLSRYIEIASHLETIKGKASPHGGIYADFRGKLGDFDALPDTTKKLWHTTEAYYLSKGMDIHKEPIEAACYAHAFNGGVRIDENGESTVEGLFAIGETAGGPHGADRLGGGMLTACQVFGKRAGLKAASLRKIVHFASLSKEVERCQNEIKDKLSAGSTSFEPAAFRHELQALSTKEILLQRSAEKCVRYLQSLDELRNRLERVHIEKAEDLQKYFEMKNLITVGSLVCCAAQNRRETRGGHIRSDYPDTSAETNWIILRKNKEGGIHAETVPSRPSTR